MPMFPTEGVVRALTEATSKVTEAKDMIERVSRHRALRRMNSQENPNFPSARQTRGDMRTILVDASNVEGKLQNITGTLSILKQWEDGWKKKQARNNFAMARIVYDLDPKPEWMIEKETANKKRKDAASKNKKEAVAKATANAASAVDKAMVMAKKKSSDQIKPKKISGDKSKAKKPKSDLAERKKVEKKSDGGSGSTTPEGELKA